MLESYAGKSRNDCLRIKSSSGGIYGEIAQWVIKQNGCVFACCYSQDLSVEYRKIENQDELYMSYGSKYVAPFLGDTFKKVKFELGKNRFVMFVGLPCHCAGLKSYLGGGYEKFVCIDLICHGVPSDKVWKKYLNGKDCIRVNMRDKSSGWSNVSYSWRFTKLDGKSYTISWQNVSYMRGFVNDLYNRPSCSCCSFKGIKRSSDITLGDFWGIAERHPWLDDNKGTSALIVHSKMGEFVLDAIKDNLILEEVDIKDIYKQNPSLISPNKKHRNYEKFFAGLDDVDNMDMFIDMLLKENVIAILMKKIRNVIGILCKRK